MKRIAITSPLRLCAMLALLLCSTLGAAAKPNIIVIFTDDMGYGDISPFSDKHKTPNLDRMAAEGIKLTDFYVSSVACTPSRSSLMTGCYAQRVGMGGNVVFPADVRGLNPSETTLAEMLKNVGYATGCFGKWHLGDQPGFMPMNQGFDEYEGIPYSNDMWSEAGKPMGKKNYPPLPYMKHDKVVAHIPDGASQAVLTDAISDATVDFIQRHAKKPFFAYVPLAAVHYPWFVTKERREAAGGDDFAAQITEVDQFVGRVIDTLKSLGIDRNTLVFFSNDNGGGGKTFGGPLRGGKFGPEYEGHTRVPTLAMWPGKIPAGCVCAEIGTTADVLPTLASISGAAVPTDRIIDGKNISDLLLGKPGAKSPHEVLFYGDGGVRQGKWKLVRHRVKADWFDELYDLEADLGEKTNLAAQEPERVKAMKALLDAHNAELKKSVRPAGLVQNPKPILPDVTGIPSLAELRKNPARKPVVSNGLAPEVPGLNLKDKLYQLEAKLPDLEKPFLSAAPDDKKDGLIVGQLGADGGDRAMIEAFANALAAPAKDEKSGNVDSLLIGYRGKLIYESYYRRGRANFPHYQMSITKSYTALAVGRAIQLGLLKMEDLDKPAITFLKELDTTKLVAGADTITLAQAMQMSSGIRLPDEKAKELIKNPAQLKGQAEIQAYLQYSEPIPPMPRQFKYQEPDTAIVMQVLNAVAPAGAQAFIKAELLDRMGITQYQWESAISGLPKSAAGSAILSRDMMKFGMLILNKGKWNGEQLIPAAYIDRATTPSQIHKHYGFFWWVEDFQVGGKTYHAIEGRGAGGQFIFMFPELDLIAVITSHDKGMGNMLNHLPGRIIPAFTQK